MKFDLIILQIAVIFFPGLVWAMVDSRWAVKVKPNDFHFIVRTFMFGVVSYIVTFFVYSELGWDFANFEVNDGRISLYDKAIVKQIALATAVSIVISIVWIYAATYKIETRFLQFIKATKKYGDEDVWDYMLNSSIPSVEYVHFRDFENKIVYAGWVYAFSETEKTRELALVDAKVYDFDGVELFETPLIYISRPCDNMHIEFPSRQAPQNTEAPDDRQNQE